MRRFACLLCCVAIGCVPAEDPPVSPDDQAIVDHGSVDRGADRALLDEGVDRGLAPSIDRGPLDRGPLDRGPIDRSAEDGGPADDGVIVDARPDAEAPDGEAVADEGIDAGPDGGADPGCPADPRLQAVEGSACRAPDPLDLIHPCVADDAPIACPDGLACSGPDEASYRCDAAGRIVQVQARADFGTEIWTWEYDGAGRLVGFEYAHDEGPVEAGRSLSCVHGPGGVISSRDAHFEQGPEGDARTCEEWRVDRDAAGRPVEAERLTGCEALAADRYAFTWAGDRLVESRHLRCPEFDVPCPACTLAVRAWDAACGIAERENPVMLCD